MTPQPEVGVEVAGYVVFVLFIAALALGIFG